MRDEIQEIVDNAGDQLANTQRIQTLEESANALSDADSEPDVPSAVNDEEISYMEMVPTRKGRSASRSTRCSNACSMIRAAADWCREKADAYEEAVDKHKEEPQQPTPAEVLGALTLDEASTLMEELRELADTAEEMCDNAEGAEFPGMYG